MKASHSPAVTEILTVSVYKQNALLKHWNEFEGENKYWLKEGYQNKTNFI